MHLKLDWAQPTFIKLFKSCFSSKWTVLPSTCLGNDDFSSPIIVCTCSTASCHFYTRTVSNIVYLWTYLAILSFWNSPLLSSLLENICLWSMKTCASATQLPPALTESIILFFELFQNLPHCFASHAVLYRGETWNTFNNKDKIRRNCLITVDIQ